MFDITDNLVSEGERAIGQGELFKRALILDRYPRDDYQQSALRDAITLQMDDAQVSIEGIFDFVTDTITGMFGTFYDTRPPDPNKLATETKKFMADVAKTYANHRWVSLRTMLTEPISLGILTREWMLGDTVLDDVSEPSKAIMEAIIADIDANGQRIEDFLDVTRKLGEAFYLVDPVTAVIMGQNHVEKHTPPKAPDPINVPFLGNYRVLKSAGWWTIDMHPQQPAVPKLTKPLTAFQLEQNGKALVTLLQLLLTYESKLRDYHFGLPDRSTLYKDEAKRKWWMRAEVDLGKQGARDLYALVDPYQVIPAVAGLSPHYRTIGYKYAKAFYTRMQASHK